MEKESSTEMLTGELEVKNKKCFWIIISISLVVIIGVIILIVLLVNNKKDDTEKEETKQEETSEQTSDKAEEDLTEYDKICLLLQLSSFAGKEANSFSPRAKPKNETREDGVYVKTDIKFGETFPNSYLDIYYPGPIEEV